MTFFRHRRYKMKERITIFPLDDIDHAKAVHSYLGDKVEEVEQEPHIGEHVAEMLGL